MALTLTQCFDQKNSTICQIVPLIEEIDPLINKLALRN